MNIFGNKWIYGMLGLFVVAILPWVFNVPFFHHVMIMTFMYGLLSTGWNIMGGFGSLFSFGQSAFFAVGAYASTYLYVTFQLSPWIGMFVGGILATLLGIAIGYPCSKLRGHYFAIATVAFAQALHILFNNWQLVGAATGLSPSLTGGDSFVDFQFHSNKIPYYFIMLALLLIALVIVNLVIKSKIGYYFLALRESPEVAESLGVNTALYRLVSIGLASFFTGIAGTFYAQYVLYIDPVTVFSHLLSCQIVLYAMFGGSGTLWGPVLGVGILVPLMQYTRAYWGGTGGGVDLMITGIIIMLICIFEPQGVIGLFKKIRIFQQRRPEAV